jgi:hypothetical protein
MHKYINHKKFEKALKIAKILLKKYLHSTYNSYYSVNYAITSADINKFIKCMAGVVGFPFSEVELTHFLTICKNISFEQEGIEERTKEAFEMYSEIFDKLKDYVEGDMGAI